MRAGRSGESLLFVKLVITKKSYRPPVRKRKQASAGLRKSVGGLNTFARVLKKAAKASGQVSWLREIKVSHHSGATARDSHPLPYSPLMWGTQTLNLERSVPN